MPDRFTVGMVAVAILGGACAVAHEISATRQAEATWRQADQARAGLANRVLWLREQARAAERARSNQQAEFIATATKLHPDPTVAGHAFLQAHPEISEALAARSRARTLGRYGALFISIGLTPEQITRFEDIVMQGERFSPDGGGGRWQFQVGPNQADDDEIQTQLRVFLGTTSYAQYRQYLRLMPNQEMTAELAGLLYFTDFPLTAVQADQLKEAYAAAIDAGMTKTRLLDAMLEKGKTILSPGQSAALLDIVDRMKFRTKLAQAMSVQQRAAPATDSTAGK